MLETRPICFGEPIQLQHFRTALGEGANFSNYNEHSGTAPTKLKVHKAGRQEVRGVSSPGFSGLWRCTNRVPSRTQRYVRVRAKAPASLQAAARLVELQAGGLERMPSSRCHDLWHVVGKVHRRRTALGYGFWSFIVVIGNHWLAGHGLKSRSSWARHGSST